MVESGGPGLLRSRVPRGMWLFGLGVVLCSWPAAASAVSVEIVDLAAQSPGTTETVAVRPGVPLQIRIINMNRTHPYEVDFLVETVRIKPLDFPHANVVIQPDCTKLRDDPDQVFTATLTGVEERDVPTKIHELRSLASSCEPPVSVADLISKWTTRDAEKTYSLSAGEQLFVTVRSVVGGKTDKTWVKIFSAGKRGKWLMSYGFTFVPNQDEEFFTRQDETNPEVFVITEKDPNQEWSFVPSILFTWLPQRRAVKSWSLGPAAGVGFDLNAPSVFGGVGATYNYNLFFTGGVIIHEQARLDGRYRPGQEVTENLDSEQLGVETYDWNVYLGIGFRFGSSPFKQTKGEEAEAE